MLQLYSVSTGTRVQVTTDFRLARRRHQITWEGRDRGYNGVSDMKTQKIDVPAELLDLLQRSRLAGRAGVEQVRTALAIHLFLEGLISVGKAAELAGEPRVDFEWLLVDMGLPTVRYDLADYEQDRLGIAEAERRHPAS